MPPFYVIPISLGDLNIFDGRGLAPQHGKVPGMRKGPRLEEGPQLSLFIYRGLLN